MTTELSVPPEPTPPVAGDEGSALAALIDQTVLLFHRLRVAAQEAHRQGELSAARRGVLLGLHRQGPQTVPQMARARPVSRQHIQALVDRLAADGYVELRDNPSHRRSRLVALTARGRSVAERMERRERRLHAEVGRDLPARDLHKAAEVLQAVRGRLEGEGWRRAVRSARRGRAL